jgi:hypothetical protein
LEAITDDIRFDNITGIRPIGISEAIIAWIYSGNLPQPPGKME